MYAAVVAQRGCSAAVWVAKQQILQIACIVNSHMLFRDEVTRFSTTCGHVETAGLCCFAASGGDRARCCGAQGEICVMSRQQARLTGVQVGAGQAQVQRSSLIDGAARR